MVFFKCGPNSQGFHKPNIKSKKACKYINKTIFLELFVFKDGK